MLRMGIATTRGYSHCSNDLMLNYRLQAQFGVKVITKCTGETKLRQNKMN